MPIEKLHCGMLYIVEKEAKEKKIKAAVASIMKPAYRMTGIEKRMLATIQQQKAVLWERVRETPIFTVPVCIC